MAKEKCRNCPKKGYELPSHQKNLSTKPSSPLPTPQQRKTSTNKSPTTTARMIEIMQQMSEGEHGSPVALTRVSVLSTYL